MKKTLLLCFIHGFKGGDDTFGNFPEHLRALVSHALPKVDVAAITYPKFETRGDLRECVGRFREWYVESRNARGRARMVDGEAGYRIKWWTSKCKKALLHL